MDENFMLKVLDFRLRIGRPMHVHVGVACSGHAPKSYHYTGEALDFHICNISPYTLLKHIDAIGFNGAGYYPWWKNPGFHIDNRPAQDFQRWLSPTEGQYIYLVR